MIRITLQCGSRIRITIQIARICMKLLPECLGLRTNSLFWGWSGLRSGSGLRYYYRLRFAASDWLSSYIFLPSILMLHNWFFTWNLLQISIKAHKKCYAINLTNVDLINSSQHFYCENRARKRRPHNIKYLTLLLFSLLTLFFVSTYVSSDTLMLFFILHLIGAWPSK